VSRGAWPYVVAIGLLALLFSWLNRGESMVLHLGLFTWYRAPVAPIILGGFLCGMAVMVLVGVAHERIRR
jgi:hypothetical protein